MIRLRTPRRLVVAGIALLGILAACDVNDSPIHAEAPTSTSFAPRVLAPQGGFRQADWLVLDVWKRNSTGGWDSLYHKDSIVPVQASIQVTVPLAVYLKYRVAGYITTYVNGVPRVDTAWSAVDENNIRVFFDSIPVTKSAAIQARNWAVPVTAPASPTATFTPGNSVTFKAASNELLAVGPDANLTCVDAKTNSATITALLQSPLQIWVLSCGQDSTTHPSAPQLFSWTVDTTGTGAARTPLSPTPSGNSGFVSGQNLTSAQIDPTSAIAFSGATGSRIAWNLKVDGFPTTTPDSLAYPAVPTDSASAQHRTESGSIDPWTYAKDSLSAFPLGMRLLVTAVRIDVSLGREWVSTPVRFWYGVVPPVLASRFTLVSSGWDSVSASWDLGDASLTYAARYAVGDSAMDVSRATAIPTATLASGVWGLGSLPPDNFLTIIRQVTDPKTGLSSTGRTTVKTRALPDLPVPTLLWPTSNGAQIKLSKEPDITIGSTQDSAGRTLSYKYAYSFKATSAVIDPSLETWPELTVASPRADDLGHPRIEAASGSTVFLTIASEDSTGRRSASRNLYFQVVDDATITPPQAPTNLQIRARYVDSLQFFWNSVPGCRYRLRYTLAGTTIEQDLTDTVYTIAGMLPGQVVSGVSVRAIDNISLLLSPYTSPGVNASTRLPPQAPMPTVSEWFLKLAKPTLSWTWARQAGATDEYAVEGVTDSGAIPGNPSWNAGSVTTQLSDTVEMTYGNRPAGAVYIAFGAHSTRDGITSATTWSWKKVPVAPPAIDAADVRIWQAGNNWKFGLSNMTVPLGFELAIRVKSGSSVDTLFRFSSPSGSIPLDRIGTGLTSIEAFLRRSAPTGIDLFDLGPSISRSKLILPPPTGFDLRPAARDGYWVFTAPNDLASGASARLVTTSSTPPTWFPNASGDSLVLDPDKADRYFIAQIVDEDTSALSPGRALGRMTTDPGVFPDQGAYLFPFGVTVAGVNPQVQVNGVWASAKGMIYPAGFKYGTVSLRDVAPFLVSRTTDFQYTFDSTFIDKIWDARVAVADQSLPGQDWVGVSKASVAYKSDDGKGHAYITVSQLTGLTAATPGIVGFSTVAKGEAPLDISRMPYATVGVLAASSTLNYALVIGNSSKLGVPLFFPMTISKMGSTGWTLVANLNPSLADTPPSYLDTKGNFLAATTSQISEALSSATWIGVAVSSTSTTLRAEASIASIHLVPAGSKP